MDADDKKQCNTFYETAAAKATNLESNNLIKSECLKRTLDGLNNNSSNSDEKKADEAEEEDEEKIDISPEISNKKSNDTSPMTDSNCSGSNGGSGVTSKRMSKSFSIHTFENSHHQNAHNNHHHHNHNKYDGAFAPLKKSEEEEEDSEVTKSMAFTIDFSDGKQVDAQRHKNLLERFQSRHRRGVSLSKVEDEMTESNSSSQLNAKLRSPSSARLPRKNSRDIIEPPQIKPASAGGVRLREKPKANQMRDASKRHSWSPRSSMVEPTPLHQQPQKVKQLNPLERHLKLHALTKADLKPLPLNITCLQPPLENKESHFHDDQVSEAGTYTLDGDNYTEEQKEKMNIDKFNNEKESELLQRKLEINESDSNVETDLEVIDLDQSPPPTQFSASRQSQLSALKKGRKNILEVSFCYQEPVASTTSVNNCNNNFNNDNNSKSKVSYLEKLKSRVKNIGDKTFHKTKSSDVGCFTSVTTSGVLSKNPTLDSNPKLKRKNSLTKSQVDSSEYVQGLLRTDKSSITDNDKSAAVAAGYQLNLYPHHQSPTKSRKESVGSSNTSISTAATKDDWIQEWARNAREFSRHKRNPIAPAMSSSYNFESSLEKSDQFGYFSDDLMSRSECKPQYEEFGDNLEQYHHKSQHHKKPPTTPENNDDRTINNLSEHEPLSISSARSRRILRDFDLNKQENPRLFNIKPPISPSRIPSPIGSLSSRQKRYGSNKMLYGSETDLTNDTELYLQRTAAAITTLQNIHQKNNSIRNSSLQNSPMSPLSPIRPPPPIMHHSSTKSSAAVPTHLPPHSRGQQTAVVNNDKNSVHKRNASLDSSRFTATNVMSTSLQHHLDNKLNKAHQIQSKNLLQQQQHSRHNSYDGMPTTSPQRPTNLKYSHFDQTYDDDYESMPSRDSGALPQRQKVASIKQQNSTKQQQQKQHSASPIKRSSSFNTKPQENPSPARAQLSTPKMHNKFSKAMSAPTSARIQKSASSSCFKDAIRDNNNYEEFFINDDDDLNPNNQFTPSDSDDEDNQKFSLTNELQPVSNTRFNKTFLMRCEQSKNKVGGNKPHLGVIACPNTPEMPRRDMTARSSIRERASMPRDSSLNRIYDKKPLSATSKIASNITPNNTAATAAVTSNGGGSGRVTSKYLDISKYKPEKGNNFLKRNDMKSYAGNEVKKSSSSACLQSFQRDVARTSTRSSGGAGSRPSSASTNKKKDVKKPKEVELAMWKRRASYDPLKAAAEGRKKAEEAKRLAQQQQLMLSSESGSSVMRSSKSYHSGAAGEWLDDSEDSEFDDEN